MTEHERDARKEEEEIFSSLVRLFDQNRLHPFDDEA